ncbi:MAG: right-handed parallel beta-helix repeat-containing protein [Treponema sp.]|jgi:hypothetical protein|nr:right-handed parallel beta-helix repeat-containing protein [Treponema sp.]
MAYYVSPSGNDSNPGTAALPFLTLARAVEETRTKGRDKAIILGGGAYDNTCIVLDERDSGLFIAAGEGEPLLRGGVKVGGWQNEGGDLYSLRLPPAAPADGRVLEINGKLKPRSRFPKSGFAKHLSRFDSPWLSTSGGGFVDMPTEAQRGQLIYSPGEIPKDFDWRDTEISVMHRWDESFVCVREHDPDRHTVLFSTLCGSPPGSFEVYDFAVWNSAWGMEPGHWRVDKSARVIYYRALQGEDMNTACTYIPLYDSIIKINGPVNGLTVKGVTFMTTTAPTADIKYIRERIPNTFGAAGVTGAIDSAGSLSNCVFSGLCFYNIGGWGIRLNGENSDVTVHGCLVKDAGAGGIRIKTGKNCAVSGNRVDNTGLVHYSSIGIYANGCDIIENHVSNSTYSGICGSGIGREKIIRNRVNTAMTVLDDGAGIYATFGNNGVMSNNIVENVPLPGFPYYQRHGLYIDEQANGWIVEGNITINCPSAMLSHMNDKGGNTLRNNVFASYDGDVTLSLIRCNEHRLEGNTFHAAGALTIAGRKGAISVFEGNRLYSAQGQINQIHVSDDYTRAQPAAFSSPNPLD